MGTGEEQKEKEIKPAPKLKTRTIIALCALLAWTYAMFLPLRLMKAWHETLLPGLGSVVPLMIVACAGGFLLAVAVFFIAGKYDDRVVWILYVTGAVAALLPFVNGGWMINEDARMINWNNAALTGIDGYMIFDSILTLIILGIVAYELYRYPEHERKYFLGSLVLLVAVAAFTLQPLLAIRNRTTELTTDRLGTYAKNEQNTILLFIRNDDPLSLAVDLRTLKQNEVLRGYTLYTDAVGISHDREKNFFEMITGTRPDPNLQLEEIFAERSEESAVMQPAGALHELYVPRNIMPKWILTDAFDNHGSYRYVCTSRLRTWKEIMHRSAYACTPYIFRGIWGEAAPVIMSLTNENILPEGVAQLKELIQNPTQPFTSEELEKGAVKSFFVDAIGSVELIRLLQALNDKLEAGGVRENTAVVVTSVTVDNPLLLVRECGADAPFSVSDTPLDYVEDYAPLLQAVLSGESVDEVLRSSNTETAPAVRQILEYETDAQSGEIVATATEYERTRLYGDELLGTKLMPEDIVQYAKGGLSSPEEDEEGPFVWTQSSIVKMQFFLKDSVEGDVILTYRTLSFNGTQRILVVSGDRQVESYVAKDMERKTIRIPQETIDEDGILDLMFYFPDAVSPQKIGLSEDGRTLAVQFREMTLDR